MSGIWKSDLYWFRALHAGWGSSWIGHGFQVLSDSALGHVALAGLVTVVAWRKWPRWAAAAWTGLWLAAVLVAEKDFSTLLACGLVLALFRSTPTRSLLIGLAASVVAGLVRLALEPAFDRVRPSNLGFARPLEAVYGASSFPSGHSTLVGAVAAAVIMVGPGRPWAGWMVAVWALLVGVSRVVVGVHFPSDVLGGLALGASVSALVVMMWPVPSGRD